MLSLVTSKQVPGADVYRAERLVWVCKRHLFPPKNRMPTPVFSASELTKGELQAKQRLVIVASSLGTDLRMVRFLFIRFSGRLFRRPVLSRPGIQWQRC